MVFTTGAESDEEGPIQPQNLGSSREKDRDMWGSWDYLDLEMDATLTMKVTLYKFVVLVAVLLLPVVLVYGGYVGLWVWVYAG